VAAPKTFLGQVAGGCIFAAAPFPTLDEWKLAALRLAAVAAKAKGALTRALVDVQIAAVELGDGLERFDVEDRNSPPIQFDQASAAKLLDGAVDVHGCQTETLAQLSLG
jgi:hypothetical protein